MLSYWIIEQARLAVVSVGDNGHKVRRIVLDTFGALTMVAVGLAVF